MFVNQRAQVVTIVVDAPKIAVIVVRLLALLTGGSTFDGDSPVKSDICGILSTTSSGQHYNCVLCTSVKKLETAACKTRLTGF